MMNLYFDGFKYYEGDDNTSKCKYLQPDEFFVFRPCGEPLLRGENFILSDKLERRSPGNFWIHKSQRLVDYPDLEKLSTLSESEDDEFTMACENSDFVKSTHAAVRAYNMWVPRTDGERRFKQKIDSIESNAIRSLDNHYFAQNKSGPNLKRP